VVINLFYVPGTIVGALLVDRIKPKTLMTICLLLQMAFGFFMSGFCASEFLSLSETRVGTVPPSRDNPPGHGHHMLIVRPSLTDEYLTKHIGGFAVMYGIFLSLGEAGPLVDFVSSDLPSTMN
jgi:hypothetical protein